MTEREDENRKEPLGIQPGVLVFFKPRKPYKAKMQDYGLGVFRVRERKGNFVVMEGREGETREANVRDLVVLQENQQMASALAAYEN